MGLLGTWLLLAGPGSLLASGGHVEITHDGPPLVLTLAQDLKGDTKVQGKGKGKDEPQVRVALENDPRPGIGLQKAGDWVEIVRGKRYEMIVTNTSADPIAFTLSEKSSKAGNGHVLLTAELDSVTHGQDQRRAIEKFTCDSYESDKGSKTLRAHRTQWEKVFLTHALGDGNLTIVNSHLDQLGN